MKQSQPMPRLIVQFFLCMIATFFAFRPAVSHAGDVTNLRTDELYSDIQTAIDAAVAGDTLFLAADTHAPTGTVVVDKSLTLLGESEAGAIVDVSGFNAWGIHVKASNVTLKNFTVQGDASANQQFAVKVGTGNSPSGTLETHFVNSGFAIEGVTIRDTHRTGLDFNGVTNADVTNVTCLNAASGFGFSMSSSSNVTINGLTTAGNVWGDVGIFPANDPYMFIGYDAPTGIVFGSDINLSDGMGAISVQDGDLLVGTWVGSISNDLSDGADVTVPAGFTHILHGTRDFDGLVFHAVGTQAAIWAAASGAVAAGGVSDLSIEDMVEGDIEVAAGMSIQAAIDAADAGDTITLATGTHPVATTIDVNKAVVLIGGDEATTILDCDAMVSGSYGLKVTASGVTLQDFTVDGGAAGPVFGIHVQPGTSNTTLQGLTAMNCIQNGIAFTGTNDDEGRSVVTDITVTGNGLVGIGFGASQNVTVSDVTASDNTNGDIGIYIGDYEGQPNDDLVFEEPLILASGISYTVEADDPAEFAPLVASTTDATDVLYDANANVFVPEAYHYRVQTDVPAGVLPGSPAFTSYILTKSDKVAALAGLLALNPTFGNIAARDLETGNWHVETTMDMEVALDLASENDVIALAAGTHSPAGRVDIDKSVTLQGAGQASTTMDVGGFNAWGIYITANDVTLKELTVQGNAAVNQQYLVKVGTGASASGTPETHFVNQNFLIENVTIQGAKRTGLDFNGVENAIVRNVTSTGATNGFGFSISSSKNVTVEALTTSGNAWGDVGVFPANPIYAFDGYDAPSGIVFEGPLDLSSGNGSISVQDGELLSGINWHGGIGMSLEEGAEVTVLDSDYYMIVNATRDSDGLVMQNVTTEDGAFAGALALPAYGFSGISVWDTDNESYEVAAGMSIQDAVDAAMTDDRINLRAGTHELDATVNVDKAVTIWGSGEAQTILDCDGMSTGSYGIAVQANGVSLGSFTLDGGAAGPVFGIHVQPGTSSTDLFGLTAKNCQQNGIAFTGTNDAEGRNMVEAVTVMNNGLVGLGFGASQNVTVSNVTGSGNTGGDIGIYVGSYTAQGNDDLVFEEPLNLQAGITYTVEADDPEGSLVIASTTDETDALYNADANVFVPADWKYKLQVDVPANPAGPLVTPAFTSYTLTKEALLSPLATALIQTPGLSNVVAQSLETGDWVVAPGMSLQTAIDHAEAGDVIEVFAGTHVISSTIDVNKSVTIEGTSMADVVLDASAMTPLSARVIETDADNITLRNLTIKPIADPDSEANNNIGFTIKAGSNSVPAINTGLVMENIAIDGAAERTPFDFHGLDDVTLTNLSASGTTRGNGMSFSGCKNVTVNSFSGTGNVWGSIAVYASRFIPAGGRGSENITIVGDGLNIDGAVFSQDDLSETDGDLFNTGVVVTGWGYEVYNDDFRGGYNDGPEYTFYADELADATAQALALNLGADGNTGSVIRQQSNGQWRVTDPGLSIQSAVDHANAGDKIVIAAGQFSESVLSDKPLTIEGAANGTLMDAPPGEEPVFDLASGSSETERSVLRLIEIQNAINGVSIGSHTTLDQVRSNGHTGYGVQLRGGSDIVITNSKFNGNDRGLVAVEDAEISDVTVTDSEFVGNAIGWYVPADLNGEVEAAFTGLTVSGCLVKESLGEGMEFNRLSNASFTNNTFEGNPLAVALWLEYDDFVNITLDRNTFAGGGQAIWLSIEPGTPSAQNPASLDGLSIQQNYFEGQTSSAILLGDETTPLPTNLVLTENHFSDLAGLAVEKGADGDLSIGCNWHGSGNVAGFQSTIGPDVDVLSVLLDGTDSDLEMPGFQPAEDVICATVGGCSLEGACNYEAGLLFPLNAECDFTSCAGCGDEAACNYDADASLADNSLCQYPAADNLDCDGNCLNDVDEDGVCDEDEIPGCSDVTACNYVADSYTNEDDSLCTYPAEDYLDCDGNCINDDDQDGVCHELEVEGCTDAGACNFDADATDDDSSCEYATCAGCTVTTACNYDETASISSPGQCTYPAEDYLDCDGNCLNDVDNDGVCDVVEVAGCTDDAACNYDSEATDSDDSCTYAEQYYDCDGVCLLDSDGDGVCNALEIPGCTFPNACNYDETATQENGSCEFQGCQGCTIEEACNFDPTATVSTNFLCTFPTSELLGCDGNCLNDANDNGICDEEEVVGCMDSAAANYNPNANVSGDCTPSNIGCMIESACNYDAGATIMNSSSCEFDSCNQPATAGIPTGDPVDGCTDPYACNYNDQATNDDDSCEYTSCIGCTNPAGCDYDESAIYNSGCSFDCYGCTNEVAVNYDPTATIDDGSCLVYIYGCTTPSACNYEPEATLNNGSCDFTSCVGCGEEDACNYDTEITLNDVLTCIYPEDGYNCNGDCLADADTDQICDPFEIPGCLNAGACNYNPDATDAAECTYPDTHYDCDGNCLNDTDGDGICDELEIVGCTFDTACNYDQTATDDSGTCEFLTCVGCMDEAACNFDETATLNDLLLCVYAADGYDCDDVCLVDTDNDGVCDQFEVLGCTDATACNYNSTATEEDNSCTYPVDDYGVAYVDCDGNCLNDADSDGVCDEAEVEGCMDAEACNYDSTATDDVGCEYLSCAGCTIPSACNYSPDNEIINNTVCEFAQAGYDCDGNCIDINNNGTCDIDEPTVLDCFDATACNYNENTNVVDNSLCIYLANDCDYCSGETDGTGVIVDNDADDDGVCDPDEITGCQDATACNYNINATNPPVAGQECVYTSEPCDTCSGDDDGTGTVVDGDSDEDGVCAPDEITGCQDAAACNYNVNATDPPAAGQECVYATDPCDVCSGLTNGTGFVVDGDVDGDGICNTLETVGCTYDGACNYNENATEDDGTCVFATGCDTCSGETDGTGTVVDNDSDDDGVCDANEVDGCLDASACNYNQYATEDAGNCVYATGCDFCAGGTSGEGYVANGDEDDNGTCDVDDIAGCMNAAACNYNADATQDDGSCVTADASACESCNEAGGVDVADEDGDGVCDGDEIAGCQVPEACNYNSAATDPAACVFAMGCDSCDGNGGVVDGDTNNNGVCDASETQGCMDSSACNYNADANVPDSSCVYANGNCEVCDGNGGVSVLDADADGVCDGDEIIGCQTEGACNYNADATDAGDCVFAVEACEVCDGIGGVAFNDSDADGLCDADEPLGCVGDFAPPVLVLDSIVVVSDPVADWAGLDFVDQILDAANVTLTFNDVPSMSADGTYQVTRLYYAEDACGQSSTAGQLLVASAALPGGCTYPEANNYDPAAVNNDGSCNFSSDCVTDINNDGQTGASDLLLMLSSFGDVCD